jgi:hypothetical protein
MSTHTGLSSSSKQAMQAIVPVRPATSPKAAPATGTPANFLRRTLGGKFPSRRTLGRRFPSRRTLGRRYPSRRTLGNKIP